MTRAALGLDIGGTTIGAALVTTDRQLLARTSAQTPARHGPGPILEAAAGAARHLLDRADAAGIEVHRVLGVGSAGVIDPQRGTVVSSTHHLRDWAGTDIAGGLRERLGPGRFAEVRVVNDVHAHALGERWHRDGSVADPTGARPGLEVLVAFGTGVGAALLVDGRPLPGRHFAAGHLGSSPVTAHPGLELFGEVTSVLRMEDVCAGPVILAAYRRAGGRAPAESTRELVEHARTADRREDPVAHRVLEASAEVSGAVLAGLVNTLDPEVLTLSGGLVEAGDLWWQPMLRAYERHVLPVICTRPGPAAAGSAAPLLGAAALAWQGTAPAPSPEDP